MTRALKIINTAGGYIGQEEIQPNLGFKDAIFLAKMIAVGWLKGQSWCAYFGKLVWLEAYADRPEIVTLIKRLFNGSALETLANVRASGKFVVSTTPIPGAMVVYQDGKSAQGHIAPACTGVLPGCIHTIEGNTNTDGSRDGYEVARKERSTVNQNIAGLHIVAYIYPIEI
jgi:hypothetical protein